VTMPIEMNMPIAEAKNTDLSILTDTSSMTSTVVSSSSRTSQQQLSVQLSVRPSATRSAKELIAFGITEVAVTTERLQPRCERGDATGDAQSRSASTSARVIAHCDRSCLQTLAEAIVTPVSAAGMTPRLRAIILGA